MKRKFPSKISNSNDEQSNTQDLNNICLRYDNAINDLCECENFAFSNCSRPVDDIMNNMKYQHLNSEEFECLKKIILLESYNSVIPIYQTIIGRNNGINLGNHDTSNGMIYNCDNQSAIKLSLNERYSASQSGLKFEYALNA
ncbi:hypothetical protein ACKWTF_016424 [Chironomus riparius]